MNEELTTLNGELQAKVQELTTVNDDLANLIASAEIATVFLDTECRITRFTTAATHVLNVIATDRGRPISHVGCNLVDVDMAGGARTVLESVTPLEKKAVTHDGQHYLVRIVPYRAADRTVRGVVITLVNVTALTETESALRTTQKELRRLNDALEQRIVQRTIWLELMHDATRVINDAADWNEALHKVLRRLCESLEWQLGYVHVPDGDTPDRLVPIISYVADERFQLFALPSDGQRESLGQGMSARVHADGVPVWVNDQQELRKLLPVGGDRHAQVTIRSAAVLPIRFRQEIIAVLTLFSDRTHEPAQRLSDFMSDLNAQIGKVFERERLMSRMTDLVWREQQDLLHTLHDSLGQTLTGLGMLSSGLTHRLTEADGPAAETARQIAEQAQAALEQVRQLSKGLFPLDVDAQNFMPALRQLALTTETVHGIRMFVEGDQLEIPDTRTATQLYRIAQEAITNAVKHAQAHTITIDLRAGRGATTMTIADDGVGIGTQSSAHEGMGLHIMRSRAGSIGAHVTIRSGSTGGTTVAVSGPLMNAGHNAMST